MADFSRYRTDYYKKSFDSTDRILDEIDAKLTRVTSSVTHHDYTDVNDDPGTDVESINILRKYLDFPRTKSPPEEKTANIGRKEPSEKPTLQLTHNSSFEAIPEKEPQEKKTYHAKRTDLLQLYDDDINQLRRMLKENGSDVKPNEDNTEESQNTTLNKSNPGLPTPVLEEKTVKCPEPEVENQSFCEVEEVNLTIDDGADDTQCFCGFEEELEKVIKERDELKARIRRGEASRTSIQERQELERALHSSKTALFQQRKKSRQQLEDIEEKLEEAQHYYDEKLAEKDEIIESLKVKIEPLHGKEPGVKQILATEEKTLKQQNALEEELRKKEIEIKQLNDISSRQRREIEDLKLKLEEEIKQANQTAEENLVRARKNWDEKMKVVDEISRRTGEEKEDQQNTINVLVEENKKLYNDVLSLTQKLQDFNDELDVKEKERLMEQMKIQNDNKSTTELLKSKIENLKEELSQAFAKNSQLELDARKRENEINDTHKKRENDLSARNRDLEEKIGELESELAIIVSKLKDYKADTDHKDQCISSSISDECHKLSLILHSIQPLYNKARNSFTAQSQLSIKKSICELQDTVELVCRSSNEMTCEVTRLRRDVKKRPDYISTLRSNSDVSIASEEAKMLREKLKEKDDELQQLQLNMNEWKDLTAERLAEKFQQELQLQVERKLSQHRTEQLVKHSHSQQEPDRYCNGTGAATTHTSHQTQHTNDTSTVKLLCHLQGRVKQLRTENDLLRSSSFIKGLNNHV
ncbi:uncharacterized protein LOC143461970 [Clavelina lepadiformis]|uniref:Uncharacterized protein n=1 Tax=Clavelina lepadiformis TaxID=159417 RepID=A0ABP0GNY3_CLALP